MNDKILMPKATAVWLYENTKLSFHQIADFCGLHWLEVQALANEESARMKGVDPIAAGILTQQEIHRVEQDEHARLKAQVSSLPKPSKRAKGPRYTPLNKRGDKPDAIAWVLKHAPELTDAQIVRLIGTTKNTINNIRNRTHWNMQNLEPQHPVALGLCTQADFDKTLERAKRKNDGAVSEEIPARPGTEEVPPLNPPTEIPVDDPQELPKQVGDEYRL